MNPFNNRWVALFSVLGLLLIVAELVGTGEHGGLLSQTAHSYSAADRSGPEAVEAPMPEGVGEQPPVVEDVPEEDMPQVVADDEVEDDADVTSFDDTSEPEATEDAPVEDAPVEDAPVEDDPGDE